MGLFRQRQVDASGPQAHAAGVPLAAWAGEADDFDDAGFARAIAEGRTRDPEPYPGAVDDLEITEASRHGAVAPEAVEGQWRSRSAH